MISSNAPPLMDDNAFASALRQGQVLARVPGPNVEIRLVKLGDGTLALGGFYEYNFDGDLREMAVIAGAGAGLKLGNFTQVEELGRALQEVAKAHLPPSSDPT